MIIYVSKEKGIRFCVQFGFLSDTKTFSQINPLVILANIYYTFIKDYFFLYRSYLFVFSTISLKKENRKKNHITLSFQSKELKKIIYITVFTSFCSGGICQKHLKLYTQNIKSVYKKRRIGVIMTSANIISNYRRNSGNDIYENCAEMF